MNEHHIFKWQSENQTKIKFATSTNILQKVCNLQAREHKLCQTLLYKVSLYLLVKMWIMQNVSLKIFCKVHKIISV